MCNPVRRPKVAPNRAAGRIVPGREWGNRRNAVPAHAELGAHTLTRGATGLDATYIGLYHVLLYVSYEPTFFTKRTSQVLAPFSQGREPGAAERPPPRTLLAPSPTEPSRAPVAVRSSRLLPHGTAQPGRPIGTSARSGELSLCNACCVAPGLCASSDIASSTRRARPLYDSPRMLT
jgi:hypothetical protein